MTFTVIGLPAPQGSKRHVGHGVMIESSKAVKPWREAVAHAAFAARLGAQPLDGPLYLRARFYLPRPASLSKRKLALGPCRKPDIDKLLRSTLDGIVQSGAIVDDARIVRCEVEKEYAIPSGYSGALISVEPVDRGGTSPVEGS